MARDADPIIDAVTAVYKALDPLDAAARQRVVDSVRSLLGMSAETPSPPQRQVPPPPADQQLQPPGNQDERPLSLNELINEKKPVSTTQHIALFAFYREKVENKARFARTDIREYFAKAKLAPSTNFDREFLRAVKVGWIHEDGAESYLTTKGLEAVEAGFEGKALPRGRAAAGRRGSRRKTTKSAKKRKGTKRGSQKSVKNSKKRK